MLLDFTSEGHGELEAVRRQFYGTFRREVGPKYLWWLGAESVSHVLKAALDLLIRSSRHINRPVFLEFYEFIKRFTGITYRPTASRSGTRSVTTGWALSAEKRRAITAPGRARSVTSK